jgi:DNA-binding LacI/PurR family transcriptional regulator
LWFVVGLREQFNHKPQTTNYEPTMPKAITLKELARELGVSVATVSKVINNDPSIGHYTREQVQKLVKARNYVPNGVARNFQQQKTLTLGLTVPNTLDQFFVQIINGADEAAQAAGYSVVVSQTFDEAQRTHDILDMLLSDRVDGLIASIPPATTDLAPYRRFEAVGIPVVYINRSPLDAHCHRVTCRNREAAAMGTQFLIERGHRRLAHLKGPESLATSQHRHEGFAQAVQAAGLLLPPDRVRSVDLSQRATEAVIRDWMAQPDYPTGILTYKNYLTLDALALLKREYPERLAEIAFVGYGHLPMLRYLDHKPIAALNENAEQMGREAVDLLFRLLIAENDLPPQHVQIPCELVVY